jgi:hypothetical protein
MVVSGPFHWLCVTAPGTWHLSLPGDPDSLWKNLKAELPQVQRKLRLFRVAEVPFCLLLSCRMRL